MEYVSTPVGGEIVNGRSRGISQRSGGTRVAPAAGMRTNVVIFASLSLWPWTLSLASRAAAEVQSVGIGLRVGGYGFREPSAEGRNGWNDCRMNGIGLFAQRLLSSTFFAEVGLDGYFADSFPTDGGDAAATHGHGAMDRRSALASVAGGFRMWPEARVAPYVQIGGGVELTRVEMAGREDSRVLPFGFVGFGGDLRLGDHLRLGVSIRISGMGHFEHDELASTSTLSVEPEFAAQAQFYARYE